MKSRMIQMFCSALTMVAMVTSIVPLNAQEASTATVPVKMTVTPNVANDKRTLNQPGRCLREARQGTPASNGMDSGSGGNAGLDLFILIDAPPAPAGVEPR